MFILMIEFKNYPGINSQSNPVKLTIASGPVIIENGKVLLDKHGDDNFWKFPGGRQRDEESCIQTATREVKEELGIDVELYGDPFVLIVEKTVESVNEYVILIHYLAYKTGSISPGKDVKEWAWHDVNNLPDDCAPNIKPVVEHFREKIEANVI